VGPSPFMGKKGSTALSTALYGKSKKKKSKKEIKVKTD